MNVPGFLRKYGIASSTQGENVSSGWIGIDCPFCGDSGQHASFHLTAGGFHCWKCIKKHKTRSAIKALTGVSWREVTGIMEEYFSGFGDSSGRLIEEEIVKQPFVYPGNYPIHNEMKKYLKVRGFDPEYVIGKYQLGWGGVDGYNKLRMIIPVLFNKRIVSYQGRDITNQQKIRYQDCTKASAKIYHKNILYNLDNCNENWCIAVEGVTDVWSLGDNVCATFGTGYTDAQVIMLSDFFDRVIIWYDPGYKPQLAAQTLAARLGVMGTETKVFCHNGDQDAAELPVNIRNEYMEIMRKWGSAS